MLTLLWNLSNHGHRLYAMGFQGFLSIFIEQILSIMIWVIVCINIICQDIHILILYTKAHCTSTTVDILSVTSFHSTHRKPKCWERTLNSARNSSLNIFSVLIQNILIRNKTYYKKNHWNLYNSSKNLRSVYFFI